MNRLRIFGALAALALLTPACVESIKIPPVVIAPPAPKPTPPPPEEPTAPAPAPPIVVEPPPVPEPEVPLENLNVVVHDAATAAGIPGASCVRTSTQERRTADGGGFINFAIRGAASLQCSAAGYEASAVLDLPPGNHRVPLKPIAPPAPPVVIAPKPEPSTPMSACGAADNTGKISPKCIEAVAAASTHAEACKRTGDQHTCHAFVREVAVALRTAQADPRWGLVAKTRGGANADGYGEDIVAYLPARFELTAQTNQWLGLDVIGGIGAPNARLNAGNLRPFTECGSAEHAATGWCNRPFDLWAPVPK